MRPPEENEKVVCPKTSEKYTPEKVWPGAPVPLPEGGVEHPVYGVLPTHRHLGEECDEMVGRVVPEPKKD